MKSMHLLETGDLSWPRLKRSADRRVPPGQLRPEDMDASRVEGRDTQAARQLLRHADEHTFNTPGSGEPAVHPARSHPLRGVTLSRYPLGRIDGRCRGVGPARGGAPDEDAWFGLR